VGMNQATYAKTRIAIMAAERLLPEGDLEALLQNPLGQVLDRYGLAAVREEGGSDRSVNRAVERVLLRTLLNEHANLLLPFAGPERAVLVYWVRKFVFFNLKALIRGKINEMAETQIADQLHELPRRMQLPHEELLRADNPSELLRRLEQGTYQEIARQARKVYEEKNEPFSLDAAIDRLYYSGLLKRVYATDGGEQRPLLDFLGMLLDHQNLLWLLRYRFVYGLPPSETYYLLVPKGLSLGRPALLQLVEAASFDEVIAALPASLGRWLEEADNPAKVERALEQRALQEARRTLRRSPSALARALAYLTLREADLKRVFSIVQGKVLGLDPAILRFAVGRDQPEERRQWN
jgi:V/A-type H+/Na+-transporting ATPase subunit C